MQNKKRESYIDDKSESNALLFSSIMAATAMIRASADASDITVFPAGIPFLNNSELYLTIMLEDKDAEIKNHQFGIVKIPSDHLPRFIELPSEKGRHDIILLDEIVRYSLKWLFPGFHVINSYSIKITRDAELYIEDEFSGDLMDKIKKSLIKRALKNQNVA